MGRNFGIAVLDRHIKNILRSMISITERNLHLALEKDFLFSFLSQITSQQYFPQVLTGNYIDALGVSIVS